MGEAFLYEDPCNAHEIWQWILRCCSSPQVGLEVGADVWVPCRVQVWQPGVVVKLDASEDNGAPGSITVETHGANGDYIISQGSLFCQTLTAYG